MGLEDIRRLRALPERRINYKRLGLICAPLVLIAAFFVYYFQYGPDSRVKEKASAPEKITISLLYPGQDGHLAEKTVEIVGSPTQADRANTIMAELKKIGLLSETVMLQEMVIDSDGVIYLNLTKDILLHDDGGVTKDTIALVYGIVNSFLASFRSTKKVQLLVDWKPVYTVGGIVYTYLPLEFNRQVMED